MVYPRRSGRLHFIIERNYSLIGCLSHKKAINFDLDTKKLREFHPKGITQAYTDIRNFLESMGFEHRQGSGYVSKEPMRYATVDAIVEK